MTQLVAGDSVDIASADLAALCGSSVTAVFADGDVLVFRLEVIRRIGVSEQDAHAAWIGKRSDTDSGVTFVAGESACVVHVLPTDWQGLVVERPLRDRRFTLTLRRGDAVTTLLRGRIDILTAVGSAS